MRAWKMATTTVGKPPKVDAGVHAEVPLQHAFRPVLPLLAEVLMVGLQRRWRLGRRTGIFGGLVLQHGGTGQEGGVLVP